MMRQAVLLALLAAPLSAELPPEALSGARAVRLELTLLDGEGRPAAGCRVRIRQLRHDFLFGANLFFLDGSGEPALDRRYAEEFETLFNFATLPFYWSDFEPRPGEAAVGRVLALARWCRERNIRTKGHPLVWNHEAGVAPWLPADPEQVLALSRARASACVAAFKGWVDMWDVVNELAEPFRIADNPMTNMIRALGKERILHEAFAAARSAHPQATFLINDYKTDHEYRAILELLGRAPGPTFDVVGIQSHMHARIWSAREVRRVCDRIAAWPETRGRPLHFSEISIPSGSRRGPKDGWAASDPAGEARQADAVESVYRTLFAHPHVTAATWWDFCDLGAWEGVPLGLLRRDMSRKPSFERLRRLIREEWWTDRELVTGPDGTVEAQVLFGTYAIILAPREGPERCFEVVFPRPWPPEAARSAVKRIKATVAPL